MNQQTFYNCPEKIYEHNVTAFEEVKKYLDIKNQTKECGTVVKGLWLVDSEFWWK